MTEPPSWAHLLGTDQFGRDQLSRIAAALDVSEQVRLLRAQLPHQTFGKLLATASLDKKSILLWEVSFR